MTLEIQGQELVRSFIDFLAKYQAYSDRMEHELLNGTEQEEALWIDTQFNRLQVDEVKYKIQANLAEMNGKVSDFLAGKLSYL